MTSSAARSASPAPQGHASAAGAPPPASCSAPSVELESSGGLPVVVTSYNDTSECHTDGHIQCAHVTPKLTNIVMAHSFVERLWDFGPDFSLSEQVLTDLS